MIGNKIRFIFISFLVLLAISSCETEIEVELNAPLLRSLKLLTIDGSVSEECVIQNDTITSLFRACKDSHCIPLVEGDFDYVEINGERIISGETVVDFNNVCNIVCFKSSGNKEKSHSYTAIIKSLNGIPRIDIFTEEGAIIDSKENYVNATIVIGNDPEHGQYNGKLEIRGRGNATWTDYPKKPYKLKFPEKQSLFGFPANKDWILLAEYNDKTFLRTAYMCELSKAVEMEYTVNYQHVDLFLNTEYEGTYILTDQIEKAKERVNITGDGFIIEDDGYYLQEPLYFTSKIMNYNYTLV